jgi:hypothetical protein
MSNLWVVPEELGDLADSEYAYEACKTASFLLWGMSGRKFDGTKTTTEVYHQSVTSMDHAQVLQSQNSAFTLFESFIRPPGSNTLRLKRRPVNEIQLVRIGDDLEVLDPSDYYLYDRSTIKFRNSISNEVVEITYTYGTPPPTAGHMAARTLAMEFALLWSGSDECDLPTRVQSVSRDGISFTILDQQDFLADLRTGVYAVDLFLKTVNPDRALRKPKVFSPDVPRGRRITAKPLVLPASAGDIVIFHDPGLTTVSIPLTDLGADFLHSQTGWSTEVVIYSYDQKKSMTLDGAVTVDSLHAHITIGYADAAAVLGRAEPGTWDLYATKNGATSHITSGNLSVKLSKGDPYEPPMIVM